MTFSQFLSTCFLFLFSVYGVLTFHPALLFSNKAEAGNTTLYTRGPLHEFTAATLERVNAKMLMSDFNDPAGKFEIFITGDSSLYPLLVPFCRSEFSCVHPLTGHIFIFNADFEKNKAFSPGDAEEPRTLESLLAHEMVKVQIRTKEGSLKYYLLSTNKTEGYAGHVTMETGGMKPEEFCRPAARTATLARLLENRLTIEKMKFESDSTYLSLVRDSADDKTANKKLRAATCR